MSIIHDALKRAESKNGERPRLFVSKDPQSGDAPRSKSSFLVAILAVALIASLLLSLSERRVRIQKESEVAGLRAETVSLAGELRGLQDRITELEFTLEQMNAAFDALLSEREILASKLKDLEALTVK